MADDPAYIRNFKAFAQWEDAAGALNQVAQILAFEKEAYAGNDRATVILLTAVVENALYSYLRNKLRPELTPGERKRLFGYDGILGSFGARITLAYSFGLISAAMRHELDLIRVLRNGFAHSRKSFDLVAGEVAAVCAELRFPDRGDTFVPHAFLEAVAHDELENAADKQHPRTRFIVSCHLAAEDFIVMGAPDYDGPVP